MLCIQLLCCIASDGTYQAVFSPQCSINMSCIRRGNFSETFRIWTARASQKKFSKSCLATWHCALSICICMTAQHYVLQYVLWQVTHVQTSRILTHCFWISFESTVNAWSSGRSLTGMKKEQTLRSMFTTQTKSCAWGSSPWDILPSVNWQAGDAEDKKWSKGIEEANLTAKLLAGQKLHSASIWYEM